MMFLSVCHVKMVVRLMTRNRSVRALLARDTMVVVRWWSGASGWGCRCGWLGLYASRSQGWPDTTEVMCRGTLLGSGRGDVLSIEIPRLILVRTFVRACARSALHFSCGLPSASAASGEALTSTLLVSTGTGTFPLRLNIEGVWNRRRAEPASCGASSPIPNSVTESSVADICKFTIKSVCPTRQGWTQQISDLSRPTLSDWLCRLSLR